LKEQKTEKEKMKKTSVNVGQGIGVMTGGGVVNFGNMAKTNYGNQSMTWTSSSATPFKINGEQFSGKTVKVYGNGEIYVDGEKKVGADDNNNNNNNNIKKIEITINGNVDEIKSEGPIELNITGNANKVSTTNGSVNVTGEIKGNASTVNGAINAKKINGDASTVNGKITTQK